MEFVIKDAAIINYKYSDSDHHTLWNWFEWSVAFGTAGSEFRDFLSVITTVADNQTHQNYLTIMMVTTYTYISQKHLE